MTIHAAYRDYFRKIAQHEMGHYVASRRLGFNTGDVSVQVTGINMGHSGEAVILPYEPLRSLGEIEQYLRRRIIVLFAGVLSETLFSAEPSRSVTEDNQAKAIEILEHPNSGAHVDYAKIRELRTVLRNLRFPETNPLDDGGVRKELQALSDELWGEAIELINEHFDLICGLAGNLTQRLTELKERVTITAAELEALPAVKKLKPLGSD